MKLLFLRTPWGWERVSIAPLWGELEEYGRFVSRGESFGPTERHWQYRGLVRRRALRLGLVGLVWQSLRSWYVPRNEDGSPMASEN